MTEPWAARSDSIAALAPALVKALGALDDVVKDRKAKIDTKSGPSYAYSYADLASVLAHTRPVLSAVGLAVSQTATVIDREVVVYTTVLHTSGEFLTALPMALPAGSTAQNAGSAVTYARRYALMALLGLAADDDDGASAGVRGDSGAGSVARHEPSFSVEALRLHERAKVAPDEVKTELRALADANARKLTVAAFDADEHWRAVVAGVLDAAGVVVS